MVFGVSQFDPPDELGRAWRRGARHPEVVARVGSADDFRMTGRLRAQTMLAPGPAHREPRVTTELRLESRAYRAGGSDRDKVPGIPLGSRGTDWLAFQNWLRASVDEKSILGLIRPQTINPHRRSCRLEGEAHNRSRQPETRESVTSPGG
jgi:hypothetical protein